MPKIFKMQHEPEEIKEEIPIRKSYYATVPLPRLEGMMFGCICDHWDITHKENGECWHNETGLCNCKKFVAKDFQLVIEITNADIFENELNKELEEDSFEYWNEFNLWRLKNETNNFRDEDA